MTSYNKTTKKASSLSLSLLVNPAQRSSGYIYPRSKRGFTIVELLIVIVVIGILAAIAIVSYSGIQQKARNAQVISGVKAYQSALLQYATIHSKYPSQVACLGTGYPEGVCWQGESGYRQVNADFDAEIATVMSNKPVLATYLFTIGMGNNMRAGAAWNPASYRIVYYLQGPSQDCGIGGATGVTEGGIVTQCRLVLPAL